MAHSKGKTRNDTGDASIREEWHRGKQAQCNETDKKRKRDTKNDDEECENGTY